VRALKALGELAEPDVLPRLKRFFSDSLLPWPAREERVAAYESLNGYPLEARAEFVKKGLRSRDPLVREICRRLDAPH
jgi:HEAT repeat protein